MCRRCEGSHSLDAAFTQTGPPDIVVANAGIVLEADLTATTLEIWERTIAVNLTGIFHTVQVGAGMMKARRRGAIVLTASTNSYDGEASLIAYNASKAGLLGILHTAANELGPYQIRVNAVCPGVIRTRLAELHFASNPGVLKEYFRHVPLGRAGCPKKWPKPRLSSPRIWLPISLAWRFWWMAARWLVSSALGTTRSESFLWELAITLVNLTLVTNSYVLKINLRGSYPCRNSPIR